MEISAPKEWFRLFDVLEQGKGIAILLGATDTGKSTLAQFLISHLCRRGLKVGLVDADIGQSFLGPPATIGLSVFKSHPDWEVILSPPEIFFVGSTTPEGHFPVHLKGVKRMVDKVSSYGPDVILVDTTGFVSGEGGRELKRKKIDLVCPRFILALQKDDELEPILEPYQENPLYKIHRLPLSEQVRPKSMEERRTHRTNKFRDYFKYSSIQELAIEGVQIEGEVLDPDGAPLPLDWALRINGLLIGLKDGNDETLALGLTKHYFEEKKALRLSTPLQEIQSVKTIQLSSLRLLLLYEDENL
jgi:polynucleotide 5'-hydroxyl-kinase GRC3/NOL9